jgi:hypothetical protein
MKNRYEMLDRHEKGGIVGKFPNGKRHNVPIGQGSDFPIQVTNLAGQYSQRKNGGSK